MQDVDAIRNAEHVVNGIQLLYVLKVTKYRAAHYFMNRKASKMVQIKSNISINNK